MFKRIKRSIGEWLGFRKVYCIDGKIPKVVNAHLMTKGNSSNIVIDVSPINTGSVIEITGDRFIVVGCSLEIMKYDK